MNDDSRAKAWQISWLVSCLLFIAVVVILVNLDGPQYDSYIYPLLLLEVFLISFGIRSFIGMFTTWLKLFPFSTVLLKSFAHLALVLIILILSWFLIRDRALEILGKVNSQIRINNEITVVKEPERINKLSEQEIELLINKYRESNNLIGLHHYDPLCNLARIRAEEIKTVWSHEGFESRGNELREKYCNSGNIVCSGMGENIAKGFYVSSEVVDGWANSEGHRKNMLGDFNAQCVAVSDTYIVSLLAYTSDVQNLRSIEPDLTQKVKYDYEFVKFWEEQLIETRKLRDGWKEALNNRDYDTKNVNKLLTRFDTTINIAGILWDGYTNSKISYLEAESMSEEYYYLNKEIATLTYQLNESAYQSCRNYWKKAEKEHDEDFSDQLNRCDRYLR